MILIALSLFLSSFLLFMVQPLIGKYILPWFGSSPAVWSASLLFFQVLLTGGYLVPIPTGSLLRRQARVHWLFLEFPFSSWFSARFLAHTFVTWIDLATQ
jgi:hypothetical protein